MALLMCKLCADSALLCKVYFVLLDAWIPLNSASERASTICGSAFDGNVLSRYDL